MRLFRAASLPVALILMMGCGSEPNDEITGTYRLVGVEGSPLPYLESADAECDQFISEGELTLLPGGTYSLEFSGPRDCSRGGGNRHGQSARGVRHGASHSSPGGA